MARHDSTLLSIAMGNLIVQILCLVDETSSNRVLGEGFESTQCFE